MSPSDIYVKNLFTKFQYIATWFPNSNFNLGDVGVMEGYYFKQLSTLAELNIPFVERKGDKLLTFSYASEAEMSFSADGKVNAANDLGSAETSIKFTKAGSFVFESVDCLVSEIENKFAVGEQVKKLYLQGHWDTNWVVIDSMIRSGASTIILSNSKDSNLELAASVDVPKFILTDTKIDIKVKSQTGELTKYIASQGLAPLFTTSRIKTSFLNRLTRRKGDIRFGGDVKERKEIEEGDVWDRVNL